MKKRLRIILAQLNLQVGDINGNLQKHLDAIRTAQETFAADIIVFPELSLTGYPPEDLLLRKSFIDAANSALQQLTNEIRDIYCLVGHPHSDGHHLYNSCSVIYQGKILSRYDKQQLPNYGVFDEDRYFSPGNQTCILPIKGLHVGIEICEDLWKIEPTRQAAEAGAQIILSPNASPFERDKHEQRAALLAKRAQHHNLPIVYVNHVSGQDELIFDGGSMVVNADGQIAHCAGFFNETLLPVDFELDHKPHSLPTTFTIPSELERIYQALVLGVKDYITKNRFPGVLVGVSGGID